MTITASTFDTLLEPVGDTAAPDRPVDPRSIATKAVALGICALLAGYVVLRATDTFTVITPRVAYLSTIVNEMVSPTSGRITFVTMADRVVEGEPVIGIENPNGKTVLVDASSDRIVVSRAVEVGSRVSQGDRVLSLADPTPALFLKAIVTREEAFRIARGSTATYNLPTGETAHAAIRPDTVELWPLLIADSLQPPAFFEVRVPLAANANVYSATPVDLRFDIGPLQLLANALESFGLSRSEATP